MHFHPHFFFFEGDRATHCQSISVAGRDKSALKQRIKDDVCLGTESLRTLSNLCDIRGKIRVK